MAFVLHLLIIIPLLSKGTIDCFLEKKKFHLAVAERFFCFRLNIFTSKVSNLLLSLEAEDAGVREYTQPIIYPMNISMMMFNLFCCFCFLIFPFGASKDLIRDSQGL